MADQSRKCLSTVRLQVGVVSVSYFLFRIGATMFDTIVGPYLLRVVCEKRFLENRTICDRLEQNPVIENEVREYAGFYFILYRLFLNIPAIFSGLFCGAWSDRKGRKIPMLFPCVGIILSAMCFIISLYMGPLAVWVALLGTLIQSVSGNTPVFAMTVNSYIASGSDNDQRTKQISMLYAMSSFGMSFGAFLAGLLKWELLISYGIVIGFQCLTAFVIILFLRETGNNPKNGYTEHKSETETNGITCSNLSSGIKSYISLLTEKGTNSVQTVVIVQLCLTFIYGCDINGVEDVLLMYVTARPFNWSKSWYSYYVSIRHISTGFVLLVLLPFLSNVLKLSDCTVISLGLLCNVSRYVGTGLSNKSWMIYALMTVWSVSLVTRPCNWSTLSKAANEQEQGKMFTLFSITDTVSKCVGSMVYVNLYGATVAFCPSIAFYLMGFVNVVMLLAGIASICYRRVIQCNKNVAKMEPTEKSNLQDSCNSSKLQYVSTKMDLK
ncbi:proton-coupled folate transporter-like [Mercenaria mercenaria]|uniref:proton-coupled folate transporter-like n=1 Tax=Mercenaria mercenaria TaxID=6596 RepID=UPI00234F6F93|nr:proton-coupled folate transporter-like [Mercenaria mercenaria]